VIFKFNCARNQLELLNVKVCSLMYHSFRELIKQCDKCDSEVATRDKMDEDTGVTVLVKEDNDIWAV
jgi:hypothetical protein